MLHAPCMQVLGYRRHECKYRKVPLIRPHAMSLPSWVFGRGRELDQGCQVQYDVQQRRSSDSMCWIVHIFILDLLEILCTAVHASVQHRISVVYAEVASQVENQQGAGIREGADQRYFTVTKYRLPDVAQTRLAWPKRRTSCCTVNNSLMTGCRDML